MKDIEQYIRDNRAQMDDQSPEQGHRELFEKRLASAALRSSRFTLTSAIIATALAAAIAIGIFTRTTTTQTQPCNQVEQLAQYYNERLTKSVQMLRGELLEVDNRTRIEVGIDLSRMLEQQQSLRSSLNNIEQDKSLSLLKERYSSCNEAVNQIKSLITDQI